MLNVSEQNQSRLLFPKISIDQFLAPSNLSSSLDKVDLELNDKAMQQALEKEEALSYMAPSGRYWEIEKELDSSQLRKIDTLWLQTVSCA